MSDEAKRKASRDQLNERQSLGAESLLGARLSIWESEGGGLGPPRTRRTEARSGEPGTALPESPAGPPDG